MKLKDKIIIALMLLFLALIILNESSRKRINWYPSYSVKHKIPFGTYIAYNEAKKLFYNNLKDVKFTPYVYFSKNKSETGTYVLYNTKILLGKTNVNTLLRWVAKGNNLFISSTYIDDELLDTLHIKQDLYYHTDFDKPLEIELTHPDVKVSGSITWDKGKTANFFVLPDSIKQSKNIAILGKIKSAKRDTLYNFIQYPYQKGTIYLHSFPQAFTNYFILKDKTHQSYFEGLLSFINQKKPVLWDIRTQNGTGSKGILNYILHNEAFLWAYRLSFIGLFLYILFEGKRKQRAIPVVTPLKNETLQFTKTISDMYIENNEHKEIALLHIRHFLDYVRTHLHIDTRKINDKTIQKIAEKSKTGTNIVQAFFKLVQTIEQSEKITQQTVVNLEKIIQQIKK